MRSVWLVLLAVAVLITPVTACGGGGQHSNTLTFWATNEAASVKIDKHIYERIAKPFEKRTGIDVKVEVIPWENLLQKIQTATTSGNGPDVVNIGNTWSASLQATGAFEEFDKQTMKKIGGEDKFVETAMQSSGAPGKAPTAVPLYLLPDPVLFYNKAMFKKAGIDHPPETQGEFVADAKKLTNDTGGGSSPDQYGFTFAGTDVYGLFHWVYVLGRQHGARFLDHGKPNFTSPQVVNAAKQWTDMMQQGTVPKAVAQYTGTKAIADFANGKAAMMMAPLVTVKALRDRGMTSDRFGAALQPVPDTIPAGGKPYRGYVSGTNISIFKSTNNRQGALDFVKYMTGSKQQTELANAYGAGYLPATKAALSNPDFKGKYLALAKQSIKHSVPMPQVTHEADMENYIGTAMVNLVRKSATEGNVTSPDVRAALSRAEKKMQVGG